MPQCHEYTYTKFSLIEGMSRRVVMLLTSIALLCSSSLAVAKSTTPSKGATSSKLAASSRVTRPKAKPSAKAKASPKKSSKSKRAATQAIRKPHKRKSSKAAAKPVSKPKKDTGPRPIPPEIQKLGPLSVGHPHAGYLLNAVSMPEGKAWRVTVPYHRFGTQETVDALQHCTTKVYEQFPGSEPVRLGSLSAIRGGHVPPHKSHRTGRDADVYFFRKPGARWLGAATREDIDLPRTWALLRCFITDVDAEMILIDRVPQQWIREYALAQGESPEWLSEVFDDKNGYKTALVRHVPGHVAHMHVRFFSPKARRRAVKHYDTLVKLGLVTPPVSAITHTVKKGDTLSGLAYRYKLSVNKIQELNALKSTVIKIGQKLTLQKSEDIRGARAAVWVPPRRLPPEMDRQPTARRSASVHQADAAIKAPATHAQAKRTAKHNAASHRIASN